MAVYRNEAKDRCWRLQDVSAPAAFHHCSVGPEARGARPAVPPALAPAFCIQLEPLSDLLKASLAFFDSFAGVVEALINAKKL
jgi:hypothetical protein